MNLIKIQKLNIELLLLFIFFCIGNSILPAGNYVAFVYALVLIIKNNSRDNLKLLFFLLPNLNILENLLIPSAVNVLYLLIGVKYLLCQKRYNGKIVIFVLWIFMWEMLHVFGYSDAGTILFGAINIAFNAFMFFSFIHDDKIEFYDSILYLSYGCLNSAVVFLIANPNTIYRLTTTTYRLAGYGNDPNFFSVYVLVAICGLLISMKNIQRKLFHSGLIFVLIFIGLLTSSKMYVFCLLGTFFCYFIMAFIQKRKNDIRNLRNIFIVTFVFYFAFHKVINVYIIKFLERFNETFYNSKLSNFTTGRTDNVLNYINILSEDYIGLFWGRGISYTSYYRQLYSNILAAHNTYFDIMISWGIIGTIIFLIGFSLCLRGNIRKIRKEHILEYLPLLVYMVMIFALSCFGSDMFWYILLIVFLPIRNSDKKTICSVKEIDS